jgi:hypothetical protein
MLPALYKIKKMNKAVFLITSLTILCFCKRQGDEPPSGDPLFKNAKDTACSPGFVFCTGFEESDWRSRWDDYDGNPDLTNTLIADPGPFNIEGNHVMRLRVPAGTGGADLVKVFPQIYRKLYARWYEYWEPGYDFHARNHGGGLFAGNRDYLGQDAHRPSGADFASTWFEPDASQNGRPYLYTYYRGMYMDCTDPNGACWGDHFPCFLAPNYCTNPADNAPPGKLPDVLTAGKWYKIEVMMDLGDAVNNAADANGVLDFWINDVEYGPWTKLWFRTNPDMNLTLLNIALYFHADHSVEGVYVDNVGISDKPFH